MQEEEEGNTKVLLSDVRAVAKRPFWDRKWSKTDLAYAAFIGGMHLVACLAPWTFSWPMVGLFFASYFVSGCLGITLSYHRQLSHRSFSTPKWLEYILAYCGVLAAQGDPIEWVSGHRYHHLHTDTPLDPHSPYEGFFWSHMGWLLDNDVSERSRHANNGHANSKTLAVAVCHSHTVPETLINSDHPIISHTQVTILRVGNRNNASDLQAQWFYRWLQSTWQWHVVGQFAALFALGGLPALVWGGALRIVWVYHITWFVNSASHVWGSQTFNTGDLSRNNW